MVVHRRTFQEKKAPKTYIYRPYFWTFSSIILSLITKMSLSLSKIKTLVNTEKI